jgi:glycosyltransferase involved in cell wall biosynthesis
VAVQVEANPGFSDNSSRPFRFLLIARMLWDKGVGEYVEAARVLRQSHPQVECALLGFLDVKNPAAIARAQMNAWVDEGVIQYLGSTNDPRPFLAEADCVVLPSYREGTPRSLLEAAAMARPIVTTNVEGCREVVDDGLNGFLCQVRSPVDLARKMAQMLSLSLEERLAIVQQDLQRCDTNWRHTGQQKDALEAQVRALEAEKVANAAETARLIAEVALLRADDKLERIEAEHKAKLCALQVECEARRKADVSAVAASMFEKLKTRGRC